MRPPAQFSKEADARRALALIAAQEESKAHFPHIFVKVSEDDALAFSTEAYECAWLVRTLSASFQCSARTVQLQTGAAT